MKHINIVVDKKEHKCEIEYLNNHLVQVVVENEKYLINIDNSRDGLLLESENLFYNTMIEDVFLSDCNIFINGVKHTVELKQDQLEVANNKSSGKNHVLSKDVKSPLAGVVSSINCKKGQKIKKGDFLISIMAMKMENKIFAQSDCVIKKICVKKEDKIAEGDVLFKIK